MIKKIAFVALACASVLFVACSSKDDSRTELEQDELVAYDALGIVEDNLSYKIQSAAKASMLSARTVTSTTVTGSVSGDIAGTADYSGTTSYNDTLKEVKFDGAFTFKGYSFSDYTDIYTVTGAESYGFTMNMNTYAMSYYAKGLVDVVVNGATVTLDFDYSITLVEDATAPDGYTYELSGSINGVDLEDIQAQSEKQGA